MHFFVKNKVILFSFTIFFCSLFSVLVSNGQSTNDLSKNIYSDYFPKAPCFVTDRNLRFNLPDSLSLKRNGQRGYFNIVCAFDSLSHFIGIQPSSISIYDNKSKKLVKAFYFLNNPNASYHSFNFPKTEARAYVDWAMKTIPSTVKIQRVPYSYKCGENITDTIYENLNFQIE